MPLNPHRNRCASLCLAAFAVLGAGFLLIAPGIPAERVAMLPEPALDPPVSGQASAATEVAVLAGGCFWGVQGVFEHVKGVTGVLAGYAGGDARDAEYERVATGGTGHAESVQIKFNPQEISYGRILQVFFSVVHDPTTLNRQGPDRGTQYRSAIFPLTDQQLEVSRAYIAQLQSAHVYGAAIVTRIDPHGRFFPAEPYHQDYLERHPHDAYIEYNDLPKVEALRRLYPELYRADPVLALKSH